jgi:hypothetical protein
LRIWCNSDNSNARSTSSARKPEKVTANKQNMTNADTAGMVTAAVWHGWHSGLVWSPAGGLLCLTLLQTGNYCGRAAANTDAAGAAKLAGIGFAVPPLPP